MLAGRNHPKIIRNSISKICSISRQVFSKEPENFSRKGVVGGVGGLGGVMSIMGDPLVHNAPKSLKSIKVGRVGRQEVQLCAQLRSFKPWLKYIGMIVTTRIVEHDVNCDLRRVVSLNQFQHFQGGFSIDFFAFDEGELEGFEIKRALNVEPFATRCGLCLGVLTLREPVMSGTALILEMHSVRRHDFLIRTQ